jgi:hypothetical protein
MSDHANALVCTAESPFDAAAAAIALLVEREIIEAAVGADVTTVHMHI